MNKLISMLGLCLFVFVLGNIYSVQSNKTEQIKIQSEERITIAEINAATQITLAEINSDTTKKTSLKYVIFYIVRFVLYVLSLAVITVISLQIYKRIK